MTRLGIQPNPSYAGRPVKKLSVACHDGTPFITLRCSCGTDFHLHESQVAPIHAESDVVSLCHGCGDSLEIEAGSLHQAFASMRAEGWID